MVRLSSEVHVRKRVDHDRPAEKAKRLAKSTLSQQRIPNLNRSRTAALDQSEVNRYAQERPSMYDRVG